MWMTATLAAAMIVGAPSAPEGLPDVVIAQLLIRQRRIVRIPTFAPPASAARATEWRKRKGPKCVPAGGIGAAAVVAEDSVDLLLRGGERIRAEFEEDCPDLDFYAGFYIKPGTDGQVCADRESIHVRSGGECRIERFRRLEAGRRGNGVLDRIRRGLGR